MPPSSTASSGAARPHTPVPRGLARTGPAILSYGFRPFFLLAALFALLDMAVWIGALSGLWDVGGDMGPVAWHAHEMLFGYGAAALCGFVLTAVPNWTGRLPVSGRPLLALIVLWLLGRAAMAAPGLTGLLAASAIDSLFLLALALIVGREVVAGRNWQNLRVLAGIGALAMLNLAFHAATLRGWDIGPLVRGAVGVFALLVSQVGGRIVPSFTRNYLARQGQTDLPHPADRFDQVALGIALLAALSWAALPELWPTTILATAAAAAHAIRLARWRPLPALREPLLAMLHIGYAFVVLGWAAVALASVGIIAAPSALHVLTVGGIGLMTMAVMARATRGHTGRPLKASALTIAAYGCLVAAALSRPLAEIVPDAYRPLLDLSAAAWIAAFALFLSEYAPMLLGPTRIAKAAPRP